MRGLRSIGKALRSAWGKKDLEDMMARLGTFRSEIQFSILVSLKYVYQTFLFTPRFDVVLPTRSTIQVLFSFIPTMPGTYQRQTRSLLK